MACSRSPWARYRRPRQPWAVISADPRPSSVARRSGLLPVTPALDEGPSAPKVTARCARDWIRTSVAGRARLPVRNLHAPPQQLGGPAEVAMALYASPRVKGASPCKAQSPISAASSRACRPAAIAPSQSPVILSRQAISASTRPSGLGQRAPWPGLRPRPTGRAVASSTRPSSP